MRIKIEYEVEIPDAVEFTDEEMVAWARYEAGDNGEVRNDNPLVKAEVRFEPVFGTFDVDYV